MFFGSKINIFILFRRYFNPIAHHFLRYFNLFLDVSWFPLGSIWFRSHAVQQHPPLSHFYGCYFKSLSKFFLHIISGESNSSQCWFKFSSTRPSPQTHTKEKSNSVAASGKLETLTFSRNPQWKDFFRKFLHSFIFKLKSSREENF